MTRLAATANQSKLNSWHECNGATRHVTIAQQQLTTLLSNVPRKNERIVYILLNDRQENHLH